MLPVVRRACALAPRWSANAVPALCAVPLSFERLSLWSRLSTMAGLEGSLLGMGNPLLDISAVVTQETLDKYNLKLGDQILAEEKHLPLYEELKNTHTPEYIAGGATQNSMRVAQWMLGAPGATTYMGCVGKDENAELLRGVAEKAGVRVEYCEDPKLLTGTCACCILDGERSLVANLGAANCYQESHATAPERWAIVEKAKVIYSAGFFITSSPSTMQLVAEHCADKDKTYCLNLSAVFLSEVPPFKEALQKLLPLTDVLFGNETEVAAWAASEGWEAGDLKEVALKLAGGPKKNAARPRVVVVTQGAGATILARDGCVDTYDVQPVPAEKLVDTNGAGDAFVGGFLAQLVRGKGWEECVRAGQFAGAVVVQQSGCKMPGPVADYS